MFSQSLKCVTISHVLFGCLEFWSCQQEAWHLADLKEIVTISVSQSFCIATDGRLQQTTHTVTFFLSRVHTVTLIM